MKIIRKIAFELTTEERRKIEQTYNILEDTVDLIMNNGIDDDDECEEFVNALNEACSALDKVLNHVV